MQLVYKNNNNVKKIDDGKKKYLFLSSHKLTNILVINEFFNPYMIIRTLIFMIKHSREQYFQKLFSIKNFR